VAIGTCTALLLAPYAPLVKAHGPPSNAPVGAPDDGGWPRDFTTARGAALRIFQPQIGSWDGQREMVAYSAVAYTPMAATKPSLMTNS
jgi:hypothetical protein